MAIRWMARRALGICGAILAVACAADDKSRPGADAETGTTASVVSWSDANPAFSIDCQLPGDCRNRAFALCHGGRYSVLKDTTAGAGQVVPDRGTMVVRCT